VTKVYIHAHLSLDILKLWVLTPAIWSSLALFRTLVLLLANGGIRIKGCVQIPGIKLVLHGIDPRNLAVDPDKPHFCERVVIQ